MIYVVTNSDVRLEEFTYITVEESLALLNKLSVIGVDTETSGLDPHTKELLTLQLGCYDYQVVIDCTTVDVRLYKSLIEDKTKLLLFQNAKFDLKWLLKYGIAVEYVYDTYIVEKVLNLGIKTHKCSLQAIADRYLKVYLDKSIRGDINKYGLSPEVIKYASKDVKYLEVIMTKQMEIVKRRKAEVAVKLELSFTPVIAYLEYCGIKMDVELWKTKMEQDSKDMNEALEKLNNWVINYVISKSKEIPEYTYAKSVYDFQDEFYPEIPTNIWKRDQAPIDLYVAYPYPDLFEDTSQPICLINWESSKQVIPLLKELGIDVKTKDKQTGREVESAGVPILKLQQEKSSIIPLIMEYSKSSKRCKAFGQQYLDNINPVTNRLHVEFNQLMSTGRMSCGKGEEDSTDDKSCNIQQLPNDEITRHCFIPEEGYSIVASDYSDQEGHVFAEVADEDVWLEFYNDAKERDGHSFVAKMIFEELKDIPEEDVKKVRKDLRNKAKAPRFTFNYNGTAGALHANTGMPLEECEEIYDNYFKVFYKTKEYFNRQIKSMWDNGYILISNKTNMKSYVPNYTLFKWLDANINNIHPELWNYYKEGKGMVLSGKYELLSFPMILKAITLLKEGNSLLDTSSLLNTTPSLLTYSILSRLFKTKSSYANKACNMPSQGTAAHMTKTALIMYYRSLIKRGLLYTVKIINAVHDEILIEAPDSIVQQESDELKRCMEESASFYCKKVTIKAEPAIGKVWIH